MMKNRTEQIKDCYQFEDGSLVDSSLTCMASKSKIKKILELKKVQIY